MRLAHRLVLRKCDVLIHSRHAVKPDSYATAQPHTNSEASETGRQLDTLQTL